MGEAPACTAAVPGGEMLRQHSGWRYRQHAAPMGLGESAQADLVASADALRGGFNRLRGRGRSLARNISITLKGRTLC